MVKNVSKQDTHGFREDKLQFGDRQAQFRADKHVFAADKADKHGLGEKTSSFRRSAHPPERTEYTPLYLHSRL